MSLATVPTDKQPQRITEMPRKESVDWVKAAACGSLFAGGLLLLARQKRAGILMAASGTALAMLDHQETVSQWWKAMPGYIDRAQRMMEQVEETVERITEKSSALRRAISK
ncbi:MAG: hypothetical protein WB561_10450 [Terracidiphilus sp.]